MLSTLDRPAATVARPRPLTQEPSQAFTSLIHKLHAELQARGRR